MIKITEILYSRAGIGATLTLTFDDRQRSRLRTRLDMGEEAALLLPYGTMLRNGDLLRSEDGLVVEVRAAPEKVSQASADDPLLLARVCYHLGNRHVPLQIELTWVRYPHDHVLDAMVRQLGLEVCIKEVPFEPETGAYQKTHGHSQS